MNLPRLILLSATIAASTFHVSAKNFEISNTEPVTIEIDTLCNPLMATTYHLLDHDVKAVFNQPLVIAKEDKADIIVRINKNDKSLGGKTQAFKEEVTKKGQLLITASDVHGAAYGIIELSRMIGVSPWEWWADATPAKKENFSLQEGFSLLRHPSVEYRGIFINDEDWGLMPWSSMTYEPSDTPGRIGPKTNEKIFELMLRLRANYYWPAMHECTRPFFLTEGNREVAKKYGIYIGGSHCEPMASSAAVEWKERGVGDYDYVNNSENVYSFWEDRIKDVAGQPIIYTVGMRGVHDGAMQGAKTVEEQRNVLTRVIADQRKLLGEYMGASESVPQVFIPYKEVLDVYNSGLEVPDDICLMWCDDNYGYIRHFPTEQERARKGGNGLYYHVSYWGRPHDYLWLGTFSPYLLHQQMKEAYDRGIQRMWILNVGDIKPAEYQIELFMDMAWDIDKVNEAGVEKHMTDFLGREFGENIAKELTPVMNEHYRLAFIRKPEFMGNTRTEEYNDPSWKIVKDMPWSQEQINDRLSQYRAISDKVEALADEIAPDRRDTYFQLVKYPVQAATQMNNKMLYAQMARHGAMDWSRSDAAIDSIVALTEIYNEGINNNGKWKKMMDYKPRKLPVFDPVKRDTVDGSMYEPKTPVCTFNAVECAIGDVVALPGLGYENKAATLPMDSAIKFEIPSVVSDSIMIELDFIPTHPIVDGGNLNVEVSLNGQNPQTVSYNTTGRSEEWKENVLNNRSVKQVNFSTTGKSTPRLLQIKALNEGVILDQVKIYDGNIPQ